LLDESAVVSVCRGRLQIRQLAGNSEHLLYNNATLFLVVISAIVSISCGSGSSLVLSPTPARCGITLSPTAATIGASGGTGAFTVTTARECQWSVDLPQSWVSVTSPMTGQGPGTIAYSVGPNRSLSPRTLELTVADQKAEISQQPAECTFTLSPTVISVAAAGADVKATISTDDFCQWTVAAPLPAWIVPSSTAGTGSAELSFHVASNPGGERTGAIAVSGQTVTITQAAVPAPPTVPPPPPCTYSIAPVRFTPSASGGSNQVIVTTATSCGWSISGNPAWVAVSPTSGRGNGNVAVSAQSNSGIARSANFTIATQTFNVTQAAAPCNYSVTPSSFSVSSGNQNRTITVTTQSYCSATAASNASWIQITSAPTSGGGSVVIGIDRNSGAARSSTVTIAGQSFSQNVAVAQAQR
jgi:hypothetical protein